MKKAIVCIDRDGDVRTALNLDGTGILIPFVNEPGESGKVAEMAQPARIHVAQDMLAAAEFIVSSCALKAREEIPNGRSQREP